MTIHARWLTIDFPSLSPTSVASHSDKFSMMFFRSVYPYLSVYLSVCLSVCLSSSGLSVGDRVRSWSGRNTVAGKWLTGRLVSALKTTLIRGWTMALFIVSGIKEEQVDCSYCNLL